MKQQHVSLGPVAPKWGLFMPVAASAAAGVLLVAASAPTAGQSRSYGSSSFVTGVSHRQELQFASMVAVAFMAYV